MRKKVARWRPCTAARRALDRLAEQAFDLVLCDLQMQEVDGVAVYRAVDERAPPRPAVLLMTGHAEGSAFAEFQQTTRAAILSKPVGLDDLLPRVRGLLEAGSPR